jgi:DNA-binding NtrC family response regulator
VNNALHDGSSADDATPVFVVDDERALGSLIAEILELEGFRPRVFSDPCAALDALSRMDTPPPVMVTDFAMEGLNGIELIRRSRERHPALKTVLVSGSMTDTLLDQQSTQPDAFLSKPFVPQTLVDTVRSAAQLPVR